jgi:peptidoglycan-associated lipoprotein
MSQHAMVLRVLAAVVALDVVAGCANQVPPSPQAAVASPELASAWYQIYFETDGSDITARAQMMVKTVAYVMEGSAATRVTVVGKSDRVGAMPVNMALSRRRADAVRDALITAGVPADRIDTNWTGEGRQNVATADNVAEQGNRAVDISLVKVAR